MNVPATRVEHVSCVSTREGSLGSRWAAKVPEQADGEFAINEPRPVDRFLRFVCPCGCRTVANLRIHGPEDVVPDAILGPRLAWDGNLDAPSLAGGIGPLACGWTGFLRAGVWETV